MTLISSAVRAGMLWLGLAACSSAVAREPQPRDADSWPPGNRALERTLVVGTLIVATIQESFSWRRNRPGDTLTASVSADVRNARRWVVIPAGSLVGLRIAQWGRATSPSHADARVTLEVLSVTVRGRLYPVYATTSLTGLPVSPRSGEGAVVAPGTRILFVLPEGLMVERRIAEAALTGGAR